MTQHKLLVKKGKPAPIFKMHLVEWDRWVVMYSKRLELKAHVRKVGAQVFMKNKFRRWKYQAQFMAAQNQRVELAVQHHNNVWMRKIVGTWGEFCRGRGKATRKRETYLTAWAMWAPRKRKMNALKHKTRAAVRQVRLRCLLRNWNMKIKGEALISAYGNNRLISPEYHKVSER